MAVAREPFVLARWLLKNWARSHCSRATDSEECSRCSHCQAGPRSGTWREPFSARWHSSVVPSRSIAEHRRFPYARYQRNAFCRSGAERLHSAPGLARHKGNQRTVLSRENGPRQIALLGERLDSLAARHRAAQTKQGIGRTGWKPAAELAV